MSNLIYLLYILFPIVGRYIGNGITWKWKFMYPFRSKYNILTKEPWGCTYCMSNWITIFLAWVFMPSHWIINVIFSFISCTYYLSSKKIEEYKSTLIENNNEDSESKNTNI